MCPSVMYDCLISNVEDWLVGLGELCPSVCHVDCCKLENKYRVSDKKKKKHLGKAFVHQMTFCSRKQQI